MSQWLTERVYHSGDDYFADLKHDLAGAKSSIHLQSYIFSLDVVGQEILGFLKAAVRRGVAVQLLVDGVGSRDWDYKTVDSLRSEGLNVRIYKPLPWQTRRWPRRRLARAFLFFRTLFTRFGKLNRRNHVKICILDESIAYAGGINIDARESAKRSGRAAWRDTGARVTGPEIPSLLRLCRANWEATKPHPPGALEGLVRVNFPRRIRKRSYGEFIKRILSARSRVWLATPYFVPDRTLLRALKFATWKGLDVKLLVPSRSDIPLMTLVNRYFYRSLLRAGVDIHEYSPRFLHAKVSLLDDWAIVGSTNLNQRSLIHDRELDIILKHPQSVASLAEQFLKDLRDAPLVRLRARRPWRRALQRFLLLFRHWL